VTTGIPSFTPSREQSAAKTRAVVRHVHETEAHWFAQGDPQSPTNPWMPFQPADFLSIMFDSVAELKGPEFLDVGCGPGTKMLLASHFFGLTAAGIEINPAMASAALGYGPVVRGDALAMAPGSYAEYDLVWLYRPFRDPLLEEQLEVRIMSEMKAGAVLAGGSWETCPAQLGWITVVDDWELRRGAWLKPELQDYTPTLAIETVSLPVLSCRYEAPGDLPGALPRHRVGLVLDRLGRARLRYPGDVRPAPQRAGHLVMAVVGHRADRLRAPVRLRRVDARALGDRRGVLRLRRLAGRAHRAGHLALSQRRRRQIGFL
jgi:SAM-dependent methyltransferase